VSCNLFCSSCFVILSPKRGGGGKYAVDKSLFSSACFRTCSICHRKSIIADGSVGYKEWVTDKSSRNSWNMFTQILINYEMCALFKDGGDCSWFL